MDLASLTTGNVHVGPDNPRGKGIADGSPCTRFPSFTHAQSLHTLVEHQKCTTQLHGQIIMMLTRLGMIKYIYNSCIHIHKFKITQRTTSGKQKISNSCHTYIC